MISLGQAHKHISILQPLDPIVVTLNEALGLICSEDIVAVANCPSVDSSLKDGFAVFSADIADASESSPVLLNVAGTLTAGDDTDNYSVSSGNVVRIMTGAPIPAGATAVLASEFSTVQGSKVVVTANADVGRNILRRGSDIEQGRVVARRGTVLKPTHLGLLAAAGLSEVNCCPGPRVAVVATGSELVQPGEPIKPGKVAASNMVTAAAELCNLGIVASTVLLRDNLDQLRDHFAHLIRRVDVLITCGGVLDGDKDLTMKAMEQNGMTKIFHRVRIGPGKGACMGRVGNTIIFNLPGGPPSNHVALILLALPGVRRLMGFENFLPPKRKVLVTKKIVGQSGWTQLIFSRMDYTDGSSVVPLNNLSRLEAMAAADSLIEIPEECSIIEKNSMAEVWLLHCW
ncbi:MAG: molybdopterin molybdotransferase MoeA [Deltaproteobacteria bacterium]|nr:molybdopterin molybdotransferase MoeA [Deltaproteobacteria bacterium]